MACELRAVHLAQAGCGKRGGLELVEQRLGLLPEGLAEHAAHQGAVERRGLVVGACQFAAHPVGQQARVHAEQLRHLERRAPQLSQRAKQNAAQRCLVLGLCLG